MLKIDEIKQFIQDDLTSELKRNAKTGQDYYEGKHDILNYRMFYFDSDGKIHEDTTRANIKICHPFFTELVDQEAQYLLSGDEHIVKSKNPELQAELDEYFNENETFMAELYEVVTGCISKGFEYMYAYKNSNGKLSFQCADSIGVVEVRAKDTDDKCEYVIYWYTERISKGKKEIKKIQVWDKNQTYFYVQDGKGKITEDDTAPINPRPHSVYKRDNDEQLYYETFGYIPFFRIDNTRKRFSGLIPIKDQIDDYDLMASSLSNNLVDFDTPLYVVKGFMGDNLDELHQNLKVKKMIGVPEDGNAGVDIKTIDVPYQARLTKLELDEKNIYRFGMGFNSAQLGDGNITNVVIKSRYALLDLKCNKLKIKLKEFLRKIVQVVLEEINAEKETDYQLSDVYFEFTPEIITNASDNASIELTNAQTEQVQINTLLNLANTLDSETVIKGICEILGVDYHDIKNKLPNSPEDELNNTQNILNEA